MIHPYTSISTFISFEVTQSLRHQDFVDKSKDTNEAATAALKRLDGIVGLKPVKECGSQG
jgi:hypothetical protein